MTTFNEKPSAKNTIPIRPPHELRKFQDLRILDIAAGLNHILLFAVSKASPSNSLDITSSDPNENIPIHTLAESDASANSFLESKRSFELHKPSTEYKNIVSSKPVLAKETLQAIQSNIEIDNSALNEPPFVSKSSAQIESIPVEVQTFENNTQAKPVEPVEQAESTKVAALDIPLESTISTKSTLLTEFAIAQAQTEIEQTEPNSQEDQLQIKDQIDTMDLVSKSVSNIGDSLMTDIKSIATAGEEKLNDLAKETEKTIKEVPKNVIDYVKTSVGLEKEEADNMDGVKESTVKDLPKQLTDPMLANEMANNPPIQNMHNDMLNESEQVKHNNKLNRALAQDDSNETVIDVFKNETDNNEVKFINDGVDVSSTSNIIQAMNDEINEMSNDVKNKSDELTMKYDDMMNDELTTTKDTISTKIFEMKNGITNCFGMAKIIIHNFHIFLFNSRE